MPNQKEQRDRAGAMRHDQTPAERRLWGLLRCGQLGGLKFRRQVPLGAYIADFVCFYPRVIIECDGGQHADSAYNAERDAWSISFQPAHGYPMLAWIRRRSTAAPLWRNLYAGLKVANSGPILRQEISQLASRNGLGVVPNLPPFELCDPARLVRSQSTDDHAHASPIRVK